VIDKELEKAQKEQQQIKYHYDEWLQTLVSDQYVSNDDQRISLSSSLYTIDPEIASSIASHDMRGDYLR
jgi:predicted nucleotide-binding protein (sugar kinase/HSP70/actin superfamily)